jgi:hypothetical protein
VLREVEASSGDEEQPQEEGDHMDETASMVFVDGSNVDEQGFFCYKSKPNTAGFRNKMAWLKKRFKEGLRIRMVYEGKRLVGFMEYVPGEYAWRAVEAPEYLVVQRLRVVDRGKVNSDQGGEARGCGIGSERVPLSLRRIRHRLERETDHLPLPGRQGDQADRRPSENLVVCREWHHPGRAS